MLFLLDSLFFINPPQDHHPCHKEDENGQNAGLDTPGDGDQDPVGQRAEGRGETPGKREKSEELSAVLPGREKPLERAGGSLAPSQYNASQDP